MWIAHITQGDKESQEIMSFSNEEEARSFCKKIDNAWLGKIAKDNDFKKYVQVKAWSANFHVSYLYRNSEPTDEICRCGFEVSKLYFLDEGQDEQFYINKTKAFLAENLNKNYKFLKKVYEE